MTEHQNTLGAQFAPAYHRPFLRYFDGEAGGGAGGGENTPPAGDGEQKPAGEQQQTSTKVTVDGREVDVAQLLADNAKYQREAENARVSAKAALEQKAKKTQLLSVAELAGVKIDNPDAETVETLTQKLGASIATATQDDAATRAAAQKAAVTEAAWKAGAPADKAGYLNYLTSTDAELAKLDPSAADYQTSVDARVKALVDGDPIFKASPGGAGRSGAENHGGSGGSDAVTQEVFDKMTIQEQTKLYQTNPQLFVRLSGAA